jgi:hypothetical protein
MFPPQSWALVAGDCAPSVEKAKEGIVGAKETLQSSKSFSQLNGGSYA